MRWIKLVIWAAAAITLAGHKTASATTFPIVNIGDQFSGTLYVNPSTPPSDSYPGFAYYAGHISAGVSQIGSLIVEIGGASFLTQTFNTVATSTPFTPYWSQQGFSFDQFGYVDFSTTLLLFNGPNSTSILPQDLSQYLSNEFSLFSPGSQGLAYQYLGALDSFAAAGPQGNFEFTGHITQFSINAVPEPSTWAMMIIGFAGVGFMAYRRGKLSLRPRMS